MLSQCVGRWTTTIFGARSPSRGVADRDDDNPPPILARRPERAGGEHRAGHCLRPRPTVSTNRVVAEALFCAENGWRPKRWPTSAGRCATRRYESTHALWALDLADGAAASNAERSTRVRAIAAELTAAQPASLAPARSLDIDLYAERLSSWPWSAGLSAGSTRGRAR
jgi:hypothetical protein